MKPSIYPEPASNVTLVQTHISFLFLTDNYVYKIKKPLDLGFLNFSTLDRRRFYCEEEVRLNRRLCPDVYLGVVQIRESNSGVVINGAGRTIEYAVKMRRLPENRMLNRLLQEDKVGEDDIKRIAKTIARFHNSAERNAEINRYGSISIIKNNWDENFRQVSDFVGITLSRTDLHVTEEWVSRFLEQNEKLFAERVAGGFIRDCDGDIHAENICLADKVYIFDCIEFNERFRYIDTAADIAFLLMDLDYYGKQVFSDIFTAEYLSLTGDSAIPQILGFYKIYRAFVRGKVESFKINDRSMTSEEKTCAAAKATRHFRLVRGYILREKLAPSLILFTGLMGTGKSTLASELSFELGLDLVRSDVVRKELAGMPATARDFSEYNKGIYAPEYTRATYASLLGKAERSLSAGQSIVLDASFQKRSDREPFRILAQKLGVHFFMISTSCPEDLIRKRLDDRLRADDEPSDGRWELYHLQEEEYEAVSEDEGKLLVLDTSTTKEGNLDSILRFLGLR